MPRVGRGDRRAHHEGMKPVVIRGRWYAQGNLNSCAPSKAACHHSGGCIFLTASEGMWPLLLAIDFAEILNTGLSIWDVNRGYCDLAHINRMQRNV